MMDKFNSILQQDWHETPEGRELFGRTILKMGKRRIFGLLESPPSLNIDQITYKICILGMAGVGKTSLVSKLTGREVPKSHKDTPGIQISTIYWPSKLRIIEQGKIIEKIVMFKLEFWDAGEQCLNKFNHILPACKEGADAFLLTFSFANKTTWHDIPLLISRSDIGESGARIAVGTNADKKEKVKELLSEIHDFEDVWGFPVLQISNENTDKPEGKSLSGRAEIKQVAPFLNRLISYIWIHSQNSNLQSYPTLVQQQMRAEREAANRQRQIEREFPPKSKRTERGAPTPAKRLERDLASSSSSSSPDRQQRRSISSGRMSVDERFDEISNSSTSSSRKSAMDSLTVTYC